MPRTPSSGRAGHRARRHPSAHGLAAGDERQTGHELARLRHRGPHRRLEHARRIGAPAAMLHVGELVPQRGHAPLGEGQRRYAP